jgi:hypothetical protein
MALALALALLGSLILSLAFVRLPMPSIFVMDCMVLILFLVSKVSDRAHAH